MDFWQDVRFAVRHLARAPLFAAAAVLTLALGTGANTGIFSLLNGLLRPLPVPDADRIVVVAATFHSDETGFRYRFSFPTLVDYRAANDVFSDVFGFHNQLAGLTHGGTTSQFLYHVVTGNFFTALNLQPARGRLFEPGEGEHPGGEATLVLSHMTWERRFGRDPNVIGSIVRLNGKPVRIVGVTAEGFHGLQHGVFIDGFVTIGSFIRTSQGERIFRDRAIRPFTMLARLRPGVDIDEAQPALDLVARRLEAEHPAEKGVSARIVPEPFARPVPGREMSTLLPVAYASLFGLAGLVLLITCLNVGNLLLVRATARQREMAIRAALGSGRRRLLRPVLIESCMLSAAGVLLGLLLARWSTDALLASIDPALDLPLNLAFDYDWRVFLYASAIAIGTGVLTGVLPAVRATSGRLTLLLHQGGHGGSAGTQRLRSAFVIAQIAGSLVLLVVAGLAVRNLQTARWMDPGFDHENLLTMRIDPAQAAYERERAASFFDELDRRLGALPGVQIVTASFGVPLGFFQFGCGVTSAESDDGSPERPENVFGCNAVAHDYFDALGIPILRGRPFSIHDGPRTEPVVIVNETMARRLWPGQDPLGKRLVFTASEPPLRLRTVVGVARNSKYIKVYEAPLPYVYTAIAQEPSFMRSIYVRSDMRVEDLLPRVLREVRALDPEMAVADIRTMKQTMAGNLSYIFFRLSAVQTVALGALGLLLSVIGVFGVVSYAAAQRTREIGIRLALGATPRAILGLVFGDGARLVAAGAVIGLMAGWAVTRVMSRIFFLVGAMDPSTFVSVTVLFTTLVLAACYHPASHATRVDPILVLRQE